MSQLRHPTKIKEGNLVGYITAEERENSSRYLREYQNIKYVSAWAAHCDIWQITCSCF